MASLLNTYPGWQKWLNDPNYGRDMTPEQRKLRFWPSYQQLIKQHPEYKNAISAEEFINDPYAAFKSLDTFIQGGVTQSSAAQELASADLAFPTINGTQGVADWVKRVTDAGKNPYDLLPSNLKNANGYNIVEDTLGNLGGGLADKYKYPIEGGASAPVTSTSGQSNPDLAGYDDKTIWGYDENGKPVYTKDKDAGVKVVYKDLAEMNAARIGYDESGNPVFKGQESRLKTVGFDINGNPTSDPAQKKYNTRADYLKAYPNSPSIIGYDLNGNPLEKGQENLIATNADIGKAPSGPGEGGKQTINDASWWYGGGEDFAGLGNFPRSPANAGGATWKPGVILGQEAQNRYLAGDQFAQWLPGAFQQTVAATPNAVPTPTWKSYSQGLTGPGMWAAGYPGNITVGGNAAQTGQTQQNQQVQGQQFNPYNMNAPYGFSQQQYNRQQFQTPWYQGLGGQPTQAGQSNPTLGSDQSGAPTDQGGPSLAATKTKADPNAPAATSWPLSNRSQMYTPQGVNNQGAGQPQSYAGAFSDIGNQALGSNQYG